jgi:hypothetical protein
VLKRLTTYLRSKLPPEEAFTPIFTELYFTNEFTREKKLIAYALKRIHLFESKNPIDPSLCNIEHLAPQSDGSEWAGFIGNLLWITQELNSQLGNKPFSEKRSILELESAKYPLDDVIASSAWTASSAELRGKRLASVAYNSVWKLNP